MKKRTKKTAASDRNPIEVSISIKRFVDVLTTLAGRTCRGTEYAMKLKRKDPRAFIRGDIIYVRPPGGVIRFSINSVPGDKERYYPAGITFLREGEPYGNNMLRLGMLNFPQSRTHADGQTLSIFDSYKDDAPRVRYKFSVIVQRGSDGSIGIVDPGIDHEGDQ
jgi:hypothetical protein